MSTLPPMPCLKLIVGLGNPSPQYDSTRHNVGALWVRGLADRYGIKLLPQAKFKGEVGRGSVAGVDLRLLVPSTYMNLSGESVGAVMNFYKLYLFQCFQCKKKETLKRKETEL